MGPKQEPRCEYSYPRSSFRVRYFDTQSQSCIPNSCQNIFRSLSIRSFNPPSSRKRPSQPHPPRIFAMIPATGETHRPPPKPELEDGVKTEIALDESSRGSSVSKTQEGTEELQPSHTQTQTQTEKDVFSEEGGANFRTLSWPYGMCIGTHLLHCCC